MATGERWFEFRGRVWPLFKKFAETHKDITGVNAVDPHDNANWTVHVDMGEPNRTTSFEVDPAEMKQESFEDSVRCRLEMARFELIELVTQ